MFWHPSLRLVFERFNRTTLYCLILQSGMSHPSGRTSVELGGVRVFSGRPRTGELENFLARLSKRKLSKLQTNVKKLQASLGDELFAVLKEKKLGVRFLKKNFDLIDDNGYVVFRGTEKDVKQFLQWGKMADAVRVGRRGDVVKDMLTSHIRYDRAKAVAKGFDIPPSTVATTPPPWGTGTSPDFANAIEYLYEAGARAVTTIRLTGSRSIDFNAAFRNIGITDPAVIKKILKNYTWHHLDDVNPHTLEASMQLIKKTAHVGTYSHYGGCHLVKKMLGMSKYR